jgi:Flp pilus assembly protein TadD
MALRRFPSAIRAFTECREAFRTLHALSETERGRVEDQRHDEMRAVRDAGARGATHAVQLELYLGSLERGRTALSVAFQPPSFVSLSLGSAYFRSGQLEDAERAWKAAVEADSRFGEGYNNLAALYAMSGRKAEAEAAVDAAEANGFRVHPQLKEDIRALTTPEYQSGRAADVR